MKAGIMLCGGQAVALDDLVEAAAVPAEMGNDKR
jgi:hypothetical protein